MDSLDLVDILVPHAVVHYNKEPSPSELPAHDKRRAVKRSVPPRRRADQATPLSSSSSSGHANSPDNPPRLSFSPPLTLPSLTSTSADSQRSSAPRRSSTVGWAVPAGLSVVDDSPLPATKLEGRGPLFEHSQSPTLIVWPPGQCSEVGATPLDGLQEFLESHPSGGASAYAQVPHAATQWLTSNGNAGWLQRLRRDGGVEGPLPLQLAWGCEALALFGPTEAARTVKAAKKLCQLSGFPTIICPPHANPIIRFGAGQQCAPNAHPPRDRDSNGGEGNEGGGEGGGEGNGSNGDEGNGGNEGNEGNEGDSRVGANSESVRWMDWAGESSIGNLDVNIQISDKIISTIEMIFISSFETHAFREGPEGPQPNVKSLCQVRARCNPLGEFVCIDTSHSTLGIAVEAPDIIKFMVPLTRKPEFTIKYVSTETNTNTVGLTAGVNFTSTGPVPSISVNHQRAWGSMRTVERLGTQPALPYLLRTNIGARAPIKGISYRGYDFSYQQQFPDDPWVDWLNIPLTVGAIMSKEARHGPTTPKISAINRHQFLVWAKSPNPQAPAQGVLLFVNQVIPDVKALHPEWTGVVNVNLADGAGSAPCTNSSVDTTEPSQHAVALGLLLQPSKRTTWLHHAKAKVTQLIQRFRSKSLKTLDIDVTRSVTGWEGMNRAWLTLLYPRLDEKLQPFFGEEATYNLKM